VRIWACAQAQGVDASGRGVIVRSDQHFFICKPALARATRHGRIWERCAEHRGARYADLPQTGQPSFYDFFSAASLSRRPVGMGDGGRRSARLSGFVTSGSGGGRAPGGKRRRAGFVRAGRGIDKSLPASILGPHPGFGPTTEIRIAVGTGVSFPTIDGARGRSGYRLRDADGPSSRRPRQFKGCLVACRYNPPEKPFARVVRGPLASAFSMEGAHSSRGRTATVPRLKRRDIPGTGPRLIGSEGAQYVATGLLVCRAGPRNLSPYVPREMRRDAAGSSGATYRFAKSNAGRDMCLCFR